LPHVHVGGASLPLQVFVVLGQVRLYFVLHTQEEPVQTGFGSWQFKGVPVQTPPRHWSSFVQLSPSVQDPTHVPPQHMSPSPHGRPKPHLQ